MPQPSLRQLTIDLLKKQDYDAALATTVAEALLARGVLALVQGNLPTVLKYFNDAWAARLAEDDDADRTLAAAVEDTLKKFSGSSPDEEPKKEQEEVTRKQQTNNDQDLASAPGEEAGIIIWCDFAKQTQDLEGKDITYVVNVTMREFDDTTPDKLAYAIGQFVAGVEQAIEAHQVLPLGRREGFSKDQPKQQQQQSQGRGNHQQQQRGGGNRGNQQQGRGGNSQGRGNQGGDGIEFPVSHVAIVQAKSGTLGMAFYAPRDQNKPAFRVYMDWVWTSDVQLSAIMEEFDAGQLDFDQVVKLDEQYTAVIKNSTYNGRPTKEFVEWAYHQSKEG